LRLLARKHLTFALFLVAALFVPAAAQADSLVFIKGGDVWLTDGARLARVTTDGGYESSSQADDGTIVAVQNVNGNRYLIRMNRTGKRLNAPVTTVTPDTTSFGPLNAKVSPDGKLVAYVFRRFDPDPNQAALLRFALSYSDRDTKPGDINSISGQDNPSWIGSSQILLFPTSGTDDAIVAPTSGFSTRWFQDDATDLGGGEINAAGDRLAAADGATIRVYSLNGPPPAPPAPRCEIRSPAGGYLRPTWSPEDNALAWQQADGIHVGSIDLASCEAKDVLLVPGGSYPDFGPAGVPLIVAASAPAKSTRRKVAKGLPVKVTCPQACTISAQLVVGKRVVGKATKKLGRAATATLRPRAKLKRGTKKLTVRVKAAGKTVKRTVKISG
jgi:hypothetical protein